VGVHGAAVAGEDDAAGGIVAIVARDAVAVEDRLDVAGEVVNVWQAGDGFDLAWRAIHGHEACAGHGDRPGALFVAADAGYCFAGFDGAEAVHVFDGHVVGVEGDEEEASHGGDFEVGGAVGLDRDGAENAFEREGAAECHGDHFAGVVDGLGEAVEDEELFDLAALEAGHVAAFVDVGEDERAGGLGEVDTRGDDRFAGARAQWAGLVEFDAAAEVGGQRVEFGCVALGVHCIEAGLFGDEEAVGGEGIRVAPVFFFFFADAAGGGDVVGAFLRAYNGDGAGVFGFAVAGGEDGDDVVGVGDGVGVDHERVGVHVAVVDHLARAVGVAGPEVVEAHAAAVHVFPPLVNDPPVGERPGGVVVFDVGGDGADV